MTLTEAKKLTAQDLGYKNWDSLVQTKIMDETECDAIHYMEMVAFRFASAKLKKLLEYQEFTKIRQLIF